MDPARDDVIFSPLHFRSLTVKNRILRSSLGGRFDNYDGSGTSVRLNWDVRFARGGIGAIISALAPVEPQGANIPNYAHIDRDDGIPFWREMGKRIHEHDCAYIVQLAHAGRQRDIRGFQYATGLSSTDRPDPIHGFPCRSMSESEIERTVRLFADAARRTREAGLDGIELHAAHGYLFTQFLSSAINDRKDDYGGSLRNRSRFLLEVVQAIRKEVGSDFHLQVKISACEYANFMFPWQKPGNSLEDTVQVCRWLEEAGVDGIHVSTGSSFPHPRMPAGSFSVKEAAKTYHTMIGSGKHTLRNYLMFQTWPFNEIFQRLWERAAPHTVEALNLADARGVKAAVDIPILCTGGFQTASVIRRAIEDGSCDAVTIARPLLANNDLVTLFEQGHDRPPVPCTYCNKCLFNALENPLGCYEESRFASREEMVREIMAVYEPPAFSDGNALPPASVTARSTE